MHTIVKILVAGEGGQGVQSIAEILAEAANSEGKEALYIPNFGVEQRGGISMAFLQITENGTRIGAPKFEIADILIALSSRAIERTKHHAGKNTMYIYDNSLIESSYVKNQIVGLQYFESTPPCPMNQESNKVGALKIGKDNIGDNKSCAYYNESKLNKEDIPLNVKSIYSIPANDIAKNELNPRVFNVIILGAVIAATKILPLNAIEKALEKKLGDKFKKNPALWDLNKKALSRGYDFLDDLLKGEKNGEG